VTAIREKLHALGLQAVRVDTVERFQGSECDVVLISMACGADGLGGALSPDPDYPDVDRKLLVAVSRAKSLVVLLGHRSALQRSRPYEALLAHTTQLDWAVLRRALD
jgi:superfamily I DNA and/or RNA helicase